MTPGHRALTRMPSAATSMASDWVRPMTPNLLAQYAAYWPVRPDARQVIDITLGVLLSDPDEAEILGYVALPRWLAGSSTFRFGSTSTRTELFGRTDLAFLQHLL